MSCRSDDILAHRPMHRPCLRSEGACQAGARWPLGFLYLLALSMLGPVSVLASGARIVRWRGAFGIHPWIAFKRAGTAHDTTYHIVGWRARRGGDALIINEVEASDMLWYGA